MADALKLEKVSILEPTTAEKLMKLEVFTPKEATEAVRKAIGEAGAGKLGDYDSCSFTTPERAVLSQIVKLNLI